MATPSVRTDVDVLVVGAGPTGLAAAAQLAAFGVRVRVVDRSADRAGESRALAIQPRTLEVLAPFGMARTLVERGNRDVRLVVHGRARAVPVRLFGSGLRDTAFPFLLILSQSVTEEVLGAHLARCGVEVERRTTLVAVEQDERGVDCLLTRGTGEQVRVRARFVVGADGAHSTVRRLAGIDFPGSDHPQTFVLADVEADGVDAESAHVFLERAGILFFFPLVTPATWRVIAMVPAGRRMGEPLTLADVQGIVDDRAPGVRLRDPVWLTTFRLHSRRAAALRAGRVFLAGDAAHIHSPAGGQGMNTGIQDAVNLGWKLALVADGSSPAALLGTYETERTPVARGVLAMTDRAFRIATTTDPVVAAARTHLAPRLIPLVLRAPLVRAWGFRVVGELAIRYPGSPLTAAESRWRRGVRSGERLPDGPVGGSTLHTLVAAPGFHLLLCGPPSAWDDVVVGAIVSGRRWLHVHRITPDDDRPGRARRALGWGPARPRALLIRPDGYVAATAGRDLTAVRDHLDTWLPRRAVG